MLDAKLIDEEGRIAALERYEVLDTAPEHQFDRITSIIRNVIGVPICAVSLVDRERQWFKSVQGLKVRETARSISFCTHTIKEDVPLIVLDAHLDSRFSFSALVQGPPYVRSYAGVPLRTPDGYNVGSLCAIDTAPREFTDHQIEILKSFALLVVDELELRRIAQRDHLTGALTRRGFVEQLANAIAVFDRQQRDSVLVILDIDHFKSVNDQFGHPAGDRVLKAVADACHEQLRDTDCFGRLGGEEFGILLADTNLAAGLGVAEKIRGVIQNLIADPQNDIKVTASFGLAGLVPGITENEDWMSEADDALYVAKRSGRNRCISASQGSAADAA